MVLLVRTFHRLSRELVRSSASWEYYRGRYFMQITISYPGFDVEGVVLSASANKLRVAMRDWDDAAEFLCRDGQWFAENGDAIRVNWPEPLGSIAAEKLFDRATLQSQSPAWVN